MAKSKLPAGFEKNPLIRTNRGYWDGVAARERGQHRHFCFIADVIKAMPSRAASLRTQKRSVALAFADACGGTNPRFDRERFLRACGEEC